MNNTCSDCRGSGEYLGFTSVEICKACSGAGVRETYPKFKSAIGKPDTRSIVEICKERLAKGKKPCKDKSPSRSASHELNLWLGRWFDAFGLVEPWKQMNKDRILGLRLPGKFIQRLDLDLADICSGWERHHTPSESMEWTFAGVNFQILLHEREDSDPEIVIRLTKGEKPCRSEKESTAPCSTPMLSQVVVDRLKKAMEAERELITR